MLRRLWQSLQPRHDYFFERHKVTNNPPNITHPWLDLTKL